MVFIFSTPVFEGKAIESGEYPAQELDGAVGRQFLTERGKPDEVAKQDCCVDDSIGNDLFAKDSWLGNLRECLAHLI